MCSRFEGAVSPETIKQRFGAVSPPSYRPMPELRPDNFVLAIDAQGPRLLQWGLRSKWDENLIINARAETLAQKPTFRALMNRRCIVPASAWFEWRAEPGVRGKIKFRLHRADDQAMAMAALHDGERVVIVTRAPVPSIAEIHDRMPAILPQTMERDWFMAADYTTVANLLSATPADLVAEIASPPPRQRALF